MVFTETGPKPHGYLFIAGIVTLIMFLIYVYMCEHKISVRGNLMWERAFRKAGLTDKQIRDISHDDSMWYCKSISTCVAYGGDFSERCHRHENYCAKGDLFGDEYSQALAVKKSFDNGGEHPMCPLIYPGAD